MTWQVCNFLDLEAIDVLEDEEEVFEEGDDLSDPYSPLYYFIFMLILLFLFVSEALELSLRCASTMLRRGVTIFGCCSVFVVLIFAAEERLLP